MMFVRLCLLASSREVALFEVVMTVSVSSCCHYMHQFKVVHTLMLPLRCLVGMVGLEC